jgi:hypothetical protein
VCGLAITADTSATQALTSKDTPEYGGLMLRTFQDAKTIAKTLRAELHARRQIDLTHGECLEIVSRQFGADSWNVLSVTITNSAGSAPT